MNYNNPISPPWKGLGELEITDVNNYYIDRGRMGYKVLDGSWSDTGTFGSLLRAESYGEEVGDENAYQ